MTAEQDRHLSAALRHAPDAQDAPPPAMSEAILEAARAEARRARAAREPQAPSWERVLMLLQQPAWAAGAVAVALSVVIASVWWEAPETSPAVQSRRETVPADVQREEAQRSAAPKQDASNGEAPAPVMKAAPAPASGISAPPAKPVAAKRVAPRNAAKSEARTVAESRAAAEATPAAAPAPEAAQAVAPTAAAAPPMPAPVAAPAPPAPAQRAAVRPQAAAPAQLFVPASTASLAPVEPPSLTRWRIASAQAGAQPAPALQAWLQQLSQLTAGRWHRVAAEVPPPQGPFDWSVDWREGDTLQATVQRQADTLWWHEADGSHWTATLDRDAASALPPPPAR